MMSNKHYCITWTSEIHCFFVRIDDKTPVIFVQFPDGF